MIYRIVLTGTNFDLMISGKRGQGKSYAAIRLAEKLSQLFGHTFTLDQVHFKAKTFLEQINQLELEGRLKPGMVFILDEAGIGMDAQSWWDTEIKSVADEMETYRNYNLIVIFTAPLVKNITKRAREMFHAYLKPKMPRKVDRRDLDRVESNILPDAKQSMWRLFLTEVEPSAKKGEVEVWEWRPSGKEICLDTVRINLPSSELIGYYEKKKRIYQREKRESRIQQLTEKENKPQKHTEVDAGEALEKIRENLSQYKRTWRGRTIIDKILLRKDYHLSQHQTLEIKKTLERELNGP